MAATEAMMRWIDLSAHGVKLRLFRQTDSIVNLVMTGVAVDSEEWRAVQELGFVPSATGRNLIREGSDIQTGALRKIFPRNVIRELPHSAVWIQVKGQAPTQAPVAAQEGAELGKNAQGRIVRFREDGVRYVTLEDGKTLFEREILQNETANNIFAAEIAASFLRAHNAEALALCADAFVEEMIAGKNMDSNDLRHFGGVIYAEAGAKSKPLDVTDGRLRTLQEAVEASMQRNLFTRHREANELAYRFAVGLSERQPTFAFRTSTSVQNQQYSTPLPMSIAAQHILGDTTGRKGFEPTIGNGSLVTALPIGTDITGVEIDPARAAQVRALRPDIKLTTGDVLDIAGTLDADFDFVVANPPFGGLQPAVAFEDLRVNRIDHLIALKALSRRKPDGRGVFIIAADRESLIEGGKIAGGSKSFFAWLADHYEIEDAVELDGALYRKQGAEYPVRMVTVGRRRTDEDAATALRTKAYRLGERLPVISTWDDLWEHTQGLATRLGHGVRHAPPVTKYQWSAQLRSDRNALAQAVAEQNGLVPWVAANGQSTGDSWERGTHMTDTFLSLRAFSPMYSNKDQFAVTRFFGGVYASATYDSVALADQAIKATTREEFDAVPLTEGQKAKAGPQEQDERAAESPASLLGPAITRAPLYLTLAQDLADESGLSPVTTDGVESKHEWESGAAQTESYVSLRAHQPADSNKGLYTVTRVLGGQLVSRTYDSDDLADQAINAGTREEFDALAHIDQVKAETADAAPQSEDASGAAFNVPNPPTFDYRLKQRGGQTFLVPPVGGSFSPETRTALRDWLRDAGFFANATGAHEIAVSEITGGPTLDYIVDGVEEQRIGRAVAKERNNQKALAEPVDAATDVSSKPEEIAGNADEAVHPANEAAEAPTATVTHPTGTVQQAVASEPQEAVVNDFQAPYIPASKLNEPSSMIPRNLEGPVRRALAALVEQIGMGVDEYVAGKLQMDSAEMELAFSAEQVDAIALGIKRTEEGRGFINGDQTGQGKGRVLAALARYAVLNNRPVVFTTEKANLFSDFWRDLKDIDSHHLFRPLILNNDEPIRNMDTGKTEVASIKPAALKSLLDGDLSLEDAGYNLMLATYSQFNRERSASAKATWLPTAAKGAMMLLDESHVAAGDSNTADNMALAVEHAASCVYSSATFAKNAKNMRAYAKVFPASVAVESLADTLTAGGEPLQEILSAMLGEEGVFIRREHDLSKLEFETIVTEDTRERDEQWADALSDALRAMSYFSGDVTRVMKRMDKAMKKQLQELPEAVRKGNRMGVSYQGFGSRLYNILRQFSLALKIDKVADRAVVALRDGGKPLIVLEQTFESLLKESITNSIRLDDGELTEAEQIAQNVDGTVAANGEGRVVDALTFRDVMTRVADKLQFIYVRDDYGNGHYEGVEDQAENEEELLQIRAHMAEIREKISRLPDIPVSPIDTLRQKLKEAGFTNGEISGRSFQTEPVPGDPSKIQIAIRPDQRIQTLADFNNGRLDSMTLTRAGSTGLSAHSSLKFADQRQRVMIEAQITNNVAERVQFFGRVNRRGQANLPIIVTVVTPLPSEKRVLAMQNAKLRKLSANTQSNRNNQAEMRDVPDILNPIGNEICRRYLAENPDIAALLGIDPEEESTSDDEAYFANKLTGRIALLPVEQQKAAYAELSRVFEETLKEMESRGVNPFETSVWEWGAKIVSKEVFRSGEQSGSVFDEPVYLARIEWEENLVPYTSEDIKHALQMSRSHLTQSDNRFTLSENRYATREYEKWRIDPTGLVRDIDAAFDNVQKSALKSQPQFKTLEEAIDSKESNPIKNSQMRRDWLKKQLPGLLPGGIISFTGREEEAEKGMITGFFPPVERREAHLLGQYTVRVVVPGSDKHRELSVNQLLGDPLFGREYSLGSDYNDPLKAFDTAKPGQITFSRQVLMGNMFIASQFVAQHRLGSAGIFTDETGARHRAVVLFGRVTRADVMDMPVSLNRSQMSRVLERAYTEGYTVRLIASSTLNDKNCCALIFDRNRPATLTISAPGSKASGGPIYGNKDLLDITGDFAGNRTTMSATVDFSKMEQVVEALVNRCNQSFYMDSNMAKKMLPEMTAAHDADDVDFEESAQSDAPVEDRPSRPRFAA